MKRTTLKIEQSVLRQVKRIAAEEGRSLQDIANELLRRALASQDRGEYSLVMNGWDADLQPGVDVLDRDQLFDVMNGR
jgi:hypothetical protein